MSEDSISQLRKRFSRHTTGVRPPETSYSWERKSFYLDAELVGRIDQAFRAVNHDLYPKHVSKSTFLEAIMEQGLANLDDLKTTLSQITDTE